MGKDIELQELDAQETKQSCADVREVQHALESHPDSTVAIAYRERSQSLSHVLLRKASLNNESALDVTDELVKHDILVTYHMVPVETLEKQYSTTIARGMTAAAVESARQKCGLNVLTPPKSTPAILKLINHLLAGFGWLLCIACLLCFLAWKPLGDPPDPANMYLAILVIIVLLIQGGLGFYQERKSAQVLATINNILPQQAEVLRDGRPCLITSSELVVGDIVLLKSGQKIPADVRLVSCSNFKMDKSSLTGESEPIVGTTKCTDPNFLESRNMGFYGSFIIEGQATGVIVEVGDKTVMGKIFRLSTNTNTQTTHLQKEIALFMRCVIIFGVTIGSACILLWAFRLRVQYPGFLSASGMTSNIIGLIVAFLPSGLPISIALTLTKIATQMARSNVLVKDLLTVETLGSVNLIASDKTGTLTMNDMSVSRLLWGNDEQHCTEAITSNPPPAESGMGRLMLMATLCNNSALNEDGTITGDATDRGLFKMSRGAARTYTLPPRVANVPFNSRDKFMLTIHEVSGRHHLLVIKGAPEIIFSFCSHSFSAEGSAEPMDAERLAHWKTKQDRLGSSGERVIAFACKYLPLNEFPSGFHFDTNDFNFSVQDCTLCGIVSLIDPPRREVPAAVATCQSAGIKVIMVTGDHSTTACAIARQVGIVTADTIDELKQWKELPIYDEEERRAVVVTGKDIPSLTDDMWTWVLLHREIVFARTTPDQKLEIVIENQKRGKSVAVTGDGVNDAPALKKADCGVAMGGGSDVAREAADVILLDDNFTSVVKAIELGRLVFENLKKVIMYLLPAGSWAELMPILANFILGVPLPLSPFLMVIICCFTDVATSVALVYEKPEADLMRRPPRNVHTDHLCDLKLFFYAYLNLGMIETIAGFTAYFWFMSDNDIPMDALWLCFDNWTDGYMGYTQSQLDTILFQAQCLFFTTLAISQFGNVLAVRSRKLPFVKHNPFSLDPHKRNLSFFLYITISALVVIVVVAIPGINAAFKTAGFPAKYLAVGFGFAFCIFCYDEARKWLLFLYPQSVLARLAW
eukprot:GILJ01001735.1.p1 GENE.GILJ01001735.1~~GILJ01001735.1.p1  ORF type:complete len:1054 (+),score=155.27 GILJ01001735.1:48-3164(+)